MIDLASCGIIDFINAFIAANYPVSGNQVKITPIAVPASYLQNANNFTNTSTGTANNSTKGKQSVFLGEVVSRNSIPAVNQSDTYNFYLKGVEVLSIGGNTFNNTANVSLTTNFEYTLDEANSSLITDPSVTKVIIVDPATTTPASAITKGPGTGDVGTTSGTMGYYTPPVDLGFNQPIWFDCVAFTSHNFHQVLEFVGYRIDISG